MTNIKILNNLIFLIPVLLIISCSQDNSEVDNKTVSNNKLTNLNISFLLDLSDRIDPEINPEQVELDQEAILSIVEYFKERISNKSARALKDKIRVIFHPSPESGNISEYSDTLDIDFGEQGANKKELFEKLLPIYEENISEIYSAATKREKYKGSDIWNFIRNDVRRRSIIENEKDSNFYFRNILVILTDGYMYWPDDVRNNGNRYNYITGRSKHFNQFRGSNINLLDSKFEEEDYGFITVQDSLENLEILVIGVNPSEGHDKDLDIIKKYWSKWFKEMNVKDYLILKSDLPNATQQAVNRFLQN